MKISFVLTLAGLLAFFNEACVTERPEPVVTDKPNILFILTDDQRWNALRCMGDTNILTPNIDRLARQGVLFHNHFVTTSICCCSRASILTGQYMRRHGIYDFDKPLTSAQWAETYPALLRQHGYRTGFIGKFGVGNNAAVYAMSNKFDYWRGIPGQGGRYFINPGDTNRTHQTSRMGKQALEFLGGSSTGQPFCLSISFTAPHARDHMPREYTPDDRDESLYTAITIPEPVTANDTYFHLLPKSVQTSEARTRWHWRFDSPEKFERNTKDYYRLISGIDREVGRIMATLERRGLAGNTVVIFTSDNGYFLGDRGLAGKWFMYEESLRDPLIIYDPRAPAVHRGRREDAMTLNIDFAPTMLALAGVTPPAGMQGRSLLPLAANQHPADWRKEFFYEHHFAPDIIPPSEGVRTERWAYIRWTDEKPLIEELYDLKADGLEGHNLAADPAYAETLAELRARWEKYRLELK
ncbi:MAG TPA: sulfatase [Candidatus Saccharimonadales bacterium]|nr:sulfatase [Candidatus Saccharimonadales bacterium]